MTSRTKKLLYAYRAIITGTYDYVQKCGFKKVLSA